MTLSNPKRYYARFLKGHEGKLHFAAHSHHFWPDVSRDAQLAYWDDCANSSDHKWDKIFGEVIPRTKQHIAKILNLKATEQIVIAPNTHEFSARLLSLFLGKPKLSILTSTSEFHSWRRQFLRIAELPQVSIQQIDASTVLAVRANFVSSFKAALVKKPDIAFLSQVFFDSGLALTDAELLELAEACPKETVLVIDGYHGFGAVPVDLSKLEGKIFYLGGGYKYAQCGEGVAFLVVPKGNWRPAYTGWFAEFTKLHQPANAQVGYADDGMAFMGATQDPSGCYRMNAVWDFFAAEGFGVREIHAYVKDLQREFIQHLPATFTARFSLTPLFSALDWHGHFLTFETTQADDVMKFLEGKDIIVDRRGNRIRFGFGLYQDTDDIRELCRRLT